MKAAESPTETLELSAETLSSLADDTYRSEFIARHKSRLDLAVVTQIVDRGRELLQVDPKQSLALSEAAIAVAEAVGGPLPMAHGLRAKANALHHLGNYRPAIELHHQAMQLFESAGERSQVGRTLSTSLLSLNLAGDYEQAFTAADRARDLHRIGRRIAAGAFGSQFRERVLPSGQVCGGAGVLPARIRRIAGAREPRRHRGGAGQSFGLSHQSG